MRDGVRPSRAQQLTNAQRGGHGLNHPAFSHCCARDGRAPLIRRLQTLVLWPFICSVKGKRLRKPPYNPGVRDLVQNKRVWTPALSKVAAKQGFAGWHERGYLPHRDEPGLVQFVTFRLADAFPDSLRSEWQALLEIEDEQRRRRELEAYLDLGRGECHLRHPRLPELLRMPFVFSMVSNMICVPG